MSKFWRYAVSIIAILLIGTVVAVWYFVKTLGPRARARVVDALEQRFDADVTLKSLDISMFPEPKVIGKDLVIRHKGWNDPTPLISIRRFTAETSFDTLIARTNTIRLVRLEGLEIHVPPRGQSASKETRMDHEEVASAEPGRETTHLPFLIYTIIADGTLLEIEPKVQGKVPLRFNLEKLTLHSVGPGQPMAFKTKLTNPKPPGLIDGTGTFGPWQRDDPRTTPVSGEYNFQNADLGVFNGISGVLSSTGKYNGILQHIDIDGSTDTPNFTLKRGGDPVHLTTHFHSIVNGTDGDTILDPVDAKFLSTEFVCNGGIVHMPGQNGKTVSLDAATKYGRMEDILRLVIGGKPFLTGDVDFKTKIVIPPGPEDVLNKLDLDGQFAVTSAEFTSPGVEQKLETLSDRARGISKKEQQQLPAHTVASDFRGIFKLDNGVVRFSRLSFSVPGAHIQLAGRYKLRSGALNMQGHFSMQATLSDTQSGIKHWLLKPLDPLFSKNGAGFSVPIKITGTKNHPSLEVEILHRNHKIQ